MGSETVEIIVEPFGKQIEFIKSFFNPEYRYLLYGGAIRGGKSYVGCTILLMLCRMFPKSRHIIIRKDYPSLKRNVIPVLNKVIPKKFLDRFNRSDLVYTFKNGSEILLMAESFEDDPNLEKFRGLEYNTALCEEMNELREATYYAVMQRCGSWIPPDGLTKAPSKIIGTCNPDQGWVKALYYMPWKMGTLRAPYFYLPAKIEDNPFIDQEYKDSLKSLPEEIYKVFVEGSWESVDNIFQMVPWSAINQCKSVLEADDQTVTIGADIGREGPDPTVIVVMHGGNVVEIERLPQTKTTEATDAIERMINVHNCRSDMVTVDSVGVGGGVVDELVKRGYYVNPMIGGATSVTVAHGVEYSLADLAENSHFQFKNWKAYNYWTTAQLMKDGKVGNFTNETLQADAAAIWYFTPDDRKIQVESKDNLKKRIGRSPDYWDAFCYACWGHVANQIVGDGLLMTMSQFTKAKAA